MPVLALNFDTSIDDDIRKQYNPSKLEQDSALPALPKILNEQTVENEGPRTQPQVQQKTQSQYKAQQKPKQEIHQNTVPEQTYKPVQNINNVTKGNCAVLKRGTKIRAKSLTSISDRSKKGTKIKFASKYPVSTTYFTVPAGTIFNGEIVNVHRPQLGANGGLMVIKVNSMMVKGEVYPINGYISKAHYKKIFFNNIKGERRYYKSMVQATKPGRHFLRKMVKVSANLMGDGSSAIVAPFSFTFGVLAAGANIMAAPALALFYKGGAVYVPEGADFEIKLYEDAYIYN